MLLTVLIILSPFLINFENSFLWRTVGNAENNGRGWGMLIRRTLTRVLKELKTARPIAGASGGGQWTCRGRFHRALLLTDLVI